MTRRASFKGDSLPCRLKVEQLEDRVLMNADMVLQWNDILLDAVRVDKTNPPKASRGMAIVHASIYDAVNSIVGTHEPYLVDYSAPPTASLDAATAVAAHTALVYLYPGQKSTFDAKLTAALAGIPDGPGKTAGMLVGEGVADLIIAARDGDGWNVTVSYTPGTDPGDWQPTPPAYLPALLPSWPSVTPFCMASGAEYRPDGPPALGSAEYRRAFREVYALGDVDSAIRTPEQTEIALFWADGSGTETPPGHWNSIAQVAAESQGNTLVENARLFALLNLGTADAAISSWDAKYAFDFWRPVTAIQASHDPTWMPLIVTPPFPSYTSGHSTFSSTAASVLASYFGTEYISFSISSDGLPGVVRSFQSFAEAAGEAGKSRIYGGIHWQFDNQDGLNAGYKLGKDIVDNYLKPNQPAPLPSPGLPSALSPLRPLTAVTHHDDFISHTRMENVLRPGTDIEADRSTLTSVSPHSRRILGRTGREDLPILAEASDGDKLI